MKTPIYVGDVLVGHVIHCDNLKMNDMTIRLATNVMKQIYELSSKV